MTKEEVIICLKGIKNYGQDTFTEQSDWQDSLDIAIKALEQQSIAEERYQDLVEYFGEKDVAKCVLEDREEFKKWLERIKWHVRKADELARKLEQPTSDDCVSRAELLKIYENRFIELQKAHQTVKQLGVNWCINTLKDMPPVTPTRKVGKWEYKQLGFREYGLVCTSCGYAIHIGFDFNSVEEFKDMVERKLQDPHITMDKYCCKCGAEMRGVKNV